MREMRRKDRQLSEEEAVNLLETFRFGVLGTVCADGTPYGIPMNHVLAPQPLHALRKRRRPEAGKHCPQPQGLLYRRRRGSPAGGSGEERRRGESQAAPRSSRCRRPAESARPALRHRKADRQGRVCHAFRQPPQGACRRRLRAGLGRALRQDTPDGQDGLPARRKPRLRRPPASCSAPSSACPCFRPRTHRGGLRRASWDTRSCSPYSCRRRCCSSPPTAASAPAWPRPCTSPFPLPSSFWPASPTASPCPCWTPCAWR